MGVYTRKKDNKVFETLEGKEIWVCDRCEVAFEGSIKFFDHRCQDGKLISPTLRKFSVCMVENGMRKVMMYFLVRTDEKMMTGPVLLREGEYHFIMNEPIEEGKK